MEARTFTFVTGAGAFVYVIDEHGIHLVKVIPEMPGWENHFKALAATATVVQGTRGVRASELHGHAEKFMDSLAGTLIKEVEAATLTSAPR